MMTGKDKNNKIDPIPQDKNRGNLQFLKGAPVKRIHFEEIDSTNSWAKTHTGEWAPSSVTLVTASGQTGGRGRFKRRWESPSGLNIYATYCFWFDPNRTDVGHIPQLLSLAAAETLEREGFSPKIKWPNDVLLNGKKVAGILCETISGEERRGIICGIGLNVNMPQEMLEQIDRPATSLLAESGVEWGVKNILDKLTDAFILFLEAFVQKGFGSFFQKLQGYSVYGKGDAVRFHDHQKVVEAKFEAMHPNGSVELRLPDGSKKIYYAGEFLL